MASSAATIPAAADDAVGRVLERRLRRAFAVSLAARALESIGIGWFACALTLCADQWGTSPSTALPWWAGSIAGVCAALSWWLEARPNYARFVRSVDRRNTLDGALATAVDTLERARTDARRNSLSMLLVERVESDVTGRAMFAAAWPRTPTVLAAPLLGLALFLIGLDARDVSSGPAPTLAEAASALSEAARELRTSSSAASATAGAAAPGAAQAAIADLVREADSLARSLADRAAGRAERGDVARLQPALDALRSNLIRAASTAQSAAISSAEARALSAVDAARAALGSELAQAADGARTSPFAGDSTPSTGAGTPSITSSNGPGAQSGVAPSVTDGRMVPPNAGTTPVDGAGPTATTPAIEHGTASLRWWAPTYDAVVERWAEARRDARDP